MEVVLIELATNSSVVGLWGHRDLELANDQADQYILLAYRVVSPEIFVLFLDPSNHEQ